MIKHLSQKHSVVVASLAFSREEMEEGAGLKDYCDGMIVETLPERVRWIQAFKALLGRTPSSVAYFWSSSLFRSVQQLWANNGFDLIVVHCAFMGQYVASLRNCSRIMDFGDLDSAKWLAYSNWRAWPLSLGYRLEALKLYRYEKELAEQFQHCTVTTEGEMEEFRALNVRIPCTVIPNGVDTMYFNRGTRKVEESPVIVFLGRMDYFPNVDAICYFVNRIWPAIQRDVPTVRLRIIGSNPAGKVRRLSRLPGISVTGYVPDVRSFLVDSAVSVAPLRIARGTQNKILESMAMGIPTVATLEAAKGVQAIPGEHLLVADAPDDFARKVVEILQNRELGTRLGEAGRRRVEEVHAWPFSMDVLEKVLNDVSKSTDANR
jgi:sugar transferase (PEP-CTERM/EpsH1 system associated)